MYVGLGRKVLVGNKENSSLYDILNSEAMDLRVKMLQGRRDEIPMCDTCNAPNVCVIDNLDPHMEDLLVKYGAK